MTAQQFVSEPFTYPGGGTAAGIQVTVYHAGTSVRASIYRNETSRLINPLRTDDLGQAVFWVEPGDYDLYANGLRFPVTIEPGPGGGDPGGDLGTFVFTQSTPAATWTVDHDLNTKPVVTIVDGAGNDISRTEVDYPTNSQVVITWGSPVAGTAYLRG